MMPAFTDTIARKHTVQIFFSDGFAPECVRQSGLYDVQDNTFEHTTLPDGMARDLPSGRHKINQVTLTFLETGGVKSHFAEIQKSRKTIGFQYSIVDYEGVERDSGEAQDVRVIRVRLGDTARNEDGAVEVEVTFVIGEWVSV
jgi:hypothetical protein